MPRTLTIPPALLTLAERQDGLLTTSQLLTHGIDRGAVHRRVHGARWQVVLPGVILTNTGKLTRRQRTVAAWLWAGAASVIDGVDACRWHGIPLSPADSSLVSVVVPGTSPARSRSFVSVRRSVADIEVGGWGLVPYVDAATALIVAARGQRRTAAAVDVLSRGLQSGLVDQRQLTAARDRIGDKWCRPVDAALAAVGVGVRSPAEDDMRKLMLSSQVLPEPRWNQWLHLDDGGPDLCADALLEDAGLVVEVIGKTYHAWGQQYDDTNARKERLQAMGLVVCEATSTRIRRDSAKVLTALEAAYVRHRGRGMPAGAHLVDPPRNRRFVRF